MKVVIAVAFGELTRPRLQLRRVKLNGRSAMPTGEVMVVGVDDAASIEALATVGHHHVNVA